MADAGESVRCRCGAPAPSDPWSTEAAAILTAGAILVVTLEVPGAADAADRRRWLSLAGRQAVRRAIAAATDSDPGCVLIEAPGGVRPRIGGLACGGPGAEAAKRFGIGFSYAGDHALAVVGRDIAVGVDLEALPAPGVRDRRYQAIQEVFFSDRPGDRDARTPKEFLETWTGHEAFVKACGDGLTFPAGRRDPAAEGYAVRPLAVWPTHVAALAATAPLRNVRHIQGPPGDETSGRD